MEAGSVSFRAVVTLIVAVAFAAVFLWPRLWMDHINWSFGMDEELSDSDRQFQLRGTLILFFLAVLGLIWGAATMPDPNSH